MSAARIDVPPAHGLDVVVTVPKRLWSMWLDEGDLAYDERQLREPGILRPAPWGGEMEYGFTMGAGATRPSIAVGSRVYVVAHGRLRGWAPFVYFGTAARFGDARPGAWALVRRGGAVACTIAEPIRGFQGWRRRWWDRSAEQPFPTWRTDGVS